MGAWTDRVQAEGPPTPATSGHGPWIAGITVGAGLRAAYSGADSRQLRIVEASVLSSRLFSTALSIGLANTPRDNYAYGELSWIIVGAGAGWRHPLKGDPDGRRLLAHLSLFLPLPLVWIGDRGIRFFLPSMHEGAHYRALVFVEPFVRERIGSRH